jgi:caffeoyl-CoA O-methyltransferase
MLMSEKPMSRELKRYFYSFVPPRPEEMEEMEAYARDRSFPIVGAAAGHFCYQITRMTGARHVAELGSGYGYSTAWFAQGVKENGGGTVHHIVWDEALSKMARGHLRALGFDGIVQYHLGEAVQILSEMTGPFDLIFNDVDKPRYPASLPVIKEKLRPGGVLIIDKMLWGGQIFDENDRSPSTEGVREATRQIIDDPDWIASLVAIRDGLVVAYKNHTQDT